MRPTAQILLRFSATLVALLLLGADDTPSTPRVVLTVDGEVTQPLKLTAADLAAMPRHTIKTKDHQGKDAEFEGVPVIELLKKSGARVGEKLRGGALVDYLVVEASDGYRVVFALPEIDPAFTDRVILLADKRDGKPMVNPEGPLRIVVPGEKKHARWVRQVTNLTIRRVSTVPFNQTTPASR